MPPVEILYDPPLTGSNEIMGYAGTLTNAIAGTRIIEASWPSSGEVITAIEMEINALSLYLAEETAAGPIVGCYPAPSYNTAGGADDGVWTMTPPVTEVVGGVGSGDAERQVLRVHEWADYNAEYVFSNTSGGTANRFTLQQGWDTLGASFYIDVRTKVRRADWYTDPTNVYTFASAWNGGWLWTANFNGTQWNMAVSGVRPAGGGTWTVTIPLVDAALPANTFVWVRYTNSPDGSVRFYTSSDGSSWTLVGTVAVVGGCAITNTATASVMAGIYNANGAGFGGDIADLRIYDLGGGLLTELGLGGIDAPQQQTWTVPGSSQQWRRGQFPSFSPSDNVYGTTTGTVIARCTFPVPVPAHTVRAHFAGGIGSGFFVDRSELVRLTINPGFVGGIYRDGRVHIS